MSAPRSTEKDAKPMHFCAEWGERPVKGGDRHFTRCDRPLPCADHDLPGGESDD